MGLFGRKRSGARDGAPPENIYPVFRQNALDLTVGQLGLAPDLPVVALLMETGYPEAAATLVGVADGTTSLYFSNGGGVIGAGNHAEVARATTAWLRSFEDARSQLSALSDPQPPGDGPTQFIAVTAAGLLGATARESDLGEGSHALSPFFYAAQDAITQVRLMQAA